MCSAYPREEIPGPWGIDYERYAHEEAMKRWDARQITKLTDIPEEQFVASLPGGSRGDEGHAIVEKWISEQKPPIPPVRPWDKVRLDENGNLIGWRCSHCGKVNNPSLPQCLCDGGGREESNRLEQERTDLKKKLDETNLQLKTLQYAQQARQQKGRDDQLHQVGKVIADWIKNTCRVPDEADYDYLYQRAKSAVIQSGIPYEQTDIGFMLNRIIDNLESAGVVNHIHHRIYWVKERA
jgi:hypothetical protein